MIHIWSLQAPVLARKCYWGSYANSYDRAMNFAVSGGYAVTGALQTLPDRSRTYIVKIPS